MSDLAIISFFFTPLCLFCDKQSALRSFKDVKRGVKGNRVRLDSLVSPLLSAEYVASSERHAAEANLSHLF